MPFLDYGVDIRRVIRSTNAIELLDARHRRGVRAADTPPTEQAAVKCLYLVTRSLDPTHKWRARWAIRWKLALNAFAIAFEGRITPTGNQPLPASPGNPRLSVLPTPQANKASRDTPASRIAAAMCAAIRGADEMLCRAAHMPPKRLVSSVVSRPSISGWKPILADAVASDGAELSSAHSDGSLRGKVIGTEKDAMSTTVT